MCLIGSWYYKYLDYLGFNSTTISTDYLFSSPYLFKEKMNFVYCFFISTTEEAEEQTKFFFGKEVANRVEKANNSLVKEYTGIWWIRKENLDW